MVLKTRSCNLLTVDNRSSPRAAMAPDVDVDVVEPDERLCSRAVSWEKEELCIGWSRTRNVASWLGVCLVSRLESRISSSIGQRIGKGGTEGQGWDRPESCTKFVEVASSSSSREINKIFH